MSQTQPLRFALVGAGAIGHDHARSIASIPDARLVAIAETSEARRTEAATQYGVALAVADYRDLLGRDDIDAVTIALPNALHAPAAIAALEAGKHVHLDKPMATNAADAARIVAAARASGKTFLVGQNQRFSPAAQTVRQMVAAGAIGSVYHAKARWLRRAGIPRIGSWFTQKAIAGGGCTYDIGVHVLDLALHLIGDFDIVSVTGQTYAQFGPRGRGDGSWGKSEVDPSKPFDVDDSAFALLRYADGRSIQLEVSWAQAQETGDTNGVWLHGTEGLLTTNPLQRVRETADGWVVEQLKTLPTEVHPNRLAHFVDVLRGRAAPYVPMEQSLKVQRILDALYESSATGREVRLG